MAVAGEWRDGEIKVRLAGNAADRARWARPLDGHALPCAEHTNARSVASLASPSVQKIRVPPVAAMSNCLVRRIDVRPGERHHRAVGEPVPDRVAVERRRENVKIGTEGDAFSSVRLETGKPRRHELIVEVVDYTSAQRP